MPVATIRSKLNGSSVITGVSREDLRISDIVTCESVNTATTYQWTLLYFPTDKDGNPSSATLTTPTASATDFTVDLEGSYLVRLILDLGLPTESTQILRFRALTIFGDLRLIAAGERHDSTGIVPSDASLLGWANDNNENNQKLLYFIQRVSESGRVFYVDANRGTDYSNIQNDPSIAEGYADFSSIQDAINAATALTPAPTATQPFVIKIRAGRYVEDLVIPPFVFLIGDSPSALLLDTFSGGVVEGRSVQVQAASAGHEIDCPLPNDLTILQGIVLDNVNSGSGATLTKNGSGSALILNSSVLQSGDSITQGPSVSVKEGTLSLRSSFVHSYVTLNPSAVAIEVEGDCTLFSDDSTIKGPNGILANSAKTASCTVSIHHSFVISTLSDPSAFGIKTWASFTEIMHSRLIQEDTSSLALDINNGSIFGDPPLGIQPVVILSHTVIDGSVSYNTFALTTPKLILGSVDFNVGSLSVTPNFAALTGGFVAATIGKSLGYDPVTSGLTATTVQDAIDEVVTMIGGGGGSGLVKEPVAALSDADVSLSGTPTIDGIPLSLGQRVLLVNQLSAVENGIWELAAPVWVRPSDFAAGSQASGTQVFVADGGTYAREIWVCTNVLTSDTVDTAGLSFAQFSVSTSEEVGNGLNRDGKLFNSATSTSIDLRLTPVVCNTDAADTSIKIASTPAGTGILKSVSVYVNGVRVTLADGDAERTTSECYFSNDGGVTALDLSAIVSSDSLFWNAIVAGYDLDVADIISLEYSALPV